jgi:hypothetical protein
LGLVGVLILTFFGDLLFLFLFLFGLFLNFELILCVSRFFGLYRFEDFSESGTWLNPFALLESDFILNFLFETLLFLFFDFERE